MKPQVGHEVKKESMKEATEDRCRKITETND